MSEDQIRTELAEIRRVQRESQNEIMALFKGLKDEIIESVKEHNDCLKDEVEERNRNSTSSFRWTMGLLFTVYFGVFAWLAKDHLALKEDHKELKTDFGIELRATASQHIEAIGFDDLMNKYFPTRGEPVKKPSAKVE